MSTEKEAPATEIKEIATETQVPEAKPEAKPEDKTEEKPEPKDTETKDDDKTAKRSVESTEGKPAKKRRRRQYDDDVPLESKTAQKNSDDEDDDDEGIDDEALDREVDEEDEEDDLLEIDQSNIITTGRRTRGKVIDFSKAAEKLAQEEGVINEEDDGEDDEADEFKTN